MRRSSKTQESGHAGTAATEPLEGIILVDLAFHPVAVNDDGRSILNELGEAKEAEGCLPGLPSQLEKALHAVAPGDLSTTTVRISSDDSHYTCEVFVMQPQNPALLEPLLAIYVRKERSMTEAVRHAARSYRLTEREQEALLGIASGLTSRQIAEKMRISPNTVNAFMRLIMVKMGVTTRAGVVGKLINGKRARSEPLPPLTAKAQGL